MITMSNQKTDLHGSIETILIPSIPKELIGNQCQYMCTINFIVLRPTLTVFINNRMPIGKSIYRSIDHWLRNYIIIAVVINKLQLHKEEFLVKDEAMSRQCIYFCTYVLDTQNAVSWDTSRCIFRILLDHSLNTLN